MKFGVREICDVVFKAKSDVKIGKTLFKKGQPVLYIDTAKTSTLEGSATTVYATGGRGNTNLIAWEGEKALTFTVEDALLSPVGFAILSGAGLFNSSNKTQEVHAHQTATTTISSEGIIDLSSVLGVAKIDATAPVFAVIAEEDGSITGEMLDLLTVDEGGQKLTGADPELVGKTVFVDFYVVKQAAKVTELQIEASTFAGNYYVEASTLFRRQADGVDMPAEITIPNAKIQSNFTFNMAATGDPSTFTFTMDALPGYTLFDNTKKVLCVIQMIDESDDSKADIESVMGHHEDTQMFVDDDSQDNGDVDTNDKQAAQDIKDLKALKAIKLNAITDVDSSSDPVADALAKIQAQLPSGVNAAWKNPAPGTITAVAADYDVVLTKGTQSVETKVSIKTA